MLIPVGPMCEAHFIADTVASVRCYLGKDIPILLVDNSGMRTAQKAAQESANCEIIESKSPVGDRGALFINLCRGFTHLKAQYRLETVLRMDTDALVIAGGAIELARMRFAADPSLSSLGAFHVAATGGQRNFKSSSDALMRAASQKDEAGSLVTDAIQMAQQFGYIQGEHVLGGACFYSAAALDAFATSPLFGATPFAKLGVSEDVLFGLLLRSAGLTLGEFAEPGQPMGCKWRGLSVVRPFGTDGSVD